MTFFLIGIDYSVASPEVRERIYRRRADIVSYWERVAPGLTALLVTCNRFEIYGLAACASDGERRTACFLRSFSEDFSDAYVLEGEERIFEYGVRLACGLHSQLPGEPQIFFQLAHWSHVQRFPEALAGLWHRILVEARVIRTAADRQGRLTTCADVVFDDLQRRLRPFALRQVMVIGTGKLAELVALTRPDGVRIKFVARKNAGRARHLSSVAAGETLPPEAIVGSLESVDAVISATSSPHYVFRREHVEGLGAQRRRSLWVYDLAMPRDVAPEVGRAEGVHVVDMDAARRGYFLRHPETGRYIEAVHRLVDEMVRDRRRDHDDTSRHAAQPLGAYSS